METKNRPLLVIPPQFSSFEEMFNSQAYKDFLESEEVSNIYIDQYTSRMQGIEESKSEYTILVGKCNEPSILEKFILTHGGQKVG